MRYTKSMKKVLSGLILSTIFLLPAYVVRFEILGVPTNVPELLALVTIAVSIWHLIFGKARLALGPKLLALFRKYKSEFLGFGLLLLGLGLSTAFSADVRASLGAIKGWFLAPFLFALVIRLAHATSNIQHATYKIWAALSASGVVLALISLGYALLGQLTYDGRLRAFYDSPNELGMVLALTLTATLWFVQHAPYNMQQKIGLALPQVLALLLTQSEGSILAAIVGGVAIFLLPRLKSLDEKVLKKCCMVLVVCYVIASIALTTQLHNFIAPGERSSLASRAMIWQAAWDIGKDNWLFGIGPRQFQAKYLEYQPKYPPYQEWAAPEPHNLLLALWLSAGLVGLIGFLILIYRSGLNPIVLAVLVLGLFDTPIFDLTTSTLFFIAIIARRQ